MLFLCMSQDDVLPASRQWSFTHRYSSRSWPHTRILCLRWSAWFLYAFYGSLSTSSWTSAIIITYVARTTIFRAVHCPVRLEFPQQIIITCMNLPDDNDVHRAHVLESHIQRSHCWRTKSTVISLTGWTKWIRCSYRTQTFRRPRVLLCSWCNPGHNIPTFPLTHCIDIYIYPW